jgi:lysophospholipase L1-like esterase
MDAAVLAAAHAVLSSPLEVRHPIADVEPPSDKPLNVNPRTPNVPIPDPPPPFAVGKILNETSKQWFGRMQQFEKEFLSPGFTTGGIVLIGDSLTERFPTKDLLPGLPIVNRGIGGDKIGGSSYLGVRDRLEASVTRVAPIAIVLLIGTNDIVFARTDPGNMRQNYRTLISEIEQLAPEARLLLVSVPPAAGRFAQYSKEIADFNKFIEELAKARGLDFIDLHSALRGPDGLLPKALTTDDLHLSEEGYRIYARILRPILGTTLRQSPFQRRPMVPGSH